MGSSLVLKVVPDLTDSTYVLWAAEASRPLSLFRDIQDLRDHLWVECKRNHPHLYDTVRGTLFDPDLRIERANAFGSSAFHPKGGAPSYGFEHKQWMVPAVGGWMMLQRDNLWPYAHAFLIGDREEVEKYVSPAPWS